MKTCTTCFTAKDLSFFCKDSRNKDGYTSRCKSCNKTYLIAYRKQNREKLNAQTRAKYQKDPQKFLKFVRSWAAANKTQIKIIARKAQLRRYGLTIEDFNERLQQQAGKCAICNTTKPGRFDVFQVDHNHETGKVRGLLCASCNKGLGHFKDSVQLLIKAVRYLTCND